MLYSVIMIALKDLKRLIEDYWSQKSCKSANCHNLSGI